MLIGVPVIRSVFPSECISEALFASSVSSASSGICSQINSLRLLFGTEYAISAASIPRKSFEMSAAFSGRLSSIGEMMPTLSASPFSSISADITLANTPSASEPSFSGITTLNFPSAVSAVSSTFPRSPVKVTYSLVTVIVRPSSTCFSVISGIILTSLPYSVLM